MNQIFARLIFYTYCICFKMWFLIHKFVGSFKNNNLIFLWKRSCTLTHFIVSCSNIFGKIFSLFQFCSFKTMQTTIKVVPRNIQLWQNYNWKSLYPRKIFSLSGRKHSITEKHVHISEILINTVCSCMLQINTNKLNSKLTSKYY